MDETTAPSTAATTAPATAKPTTKPTTATTHPSSSSILEDGMIDGSGDAGKAGRRP
jgi:hypothetical protein